MEEKNVKWAWQNSPKKGSFHWKETCLLCNNWVLKGEEFYMLIIPNEIRKEYKISNFIAHKEEWDEFSKGLSDIEIAEKIIKHKKPRKKPLTNEQLKNIEYFKEACNHFGFNNCEISRNKRFVKMKKRKTSFTLIYDIIFDRVSYDTKTGEDLFGRLFSNEFVANVCNKFYELRGLDIREDFSVAKILNKTAKDVDELINK